MTPIPATELTRILAGAVVYVLLVLAWARWVRRRARAVGMGLQGERLGRCKRRGSA